MLKKFLIMFSLFLLVSCGNYETVTNDKESIEPTKNVFLFDCLEETDKSKLKRANNNKDLKNYQIKMFGTEIYGKDLIDINDNVINLKEYDKLIFQVVSVECEHCKKEIQEHLDELLELDAQLIQYFDVGSKDEIMDYYQKLGIEISDKLIIIEHKDELREYIKNTLGLTTYPTLICFKNGYVSFNNYGDVTSDSINTMYEVGFVDNIEIDEDIVSLDRTVDDVKASLSVDNLNKLKTLDNDNYTLDLTFLIMGKKVNLDTISNRDSKVFINEINDFSIYKDKNLILIYDYFRDEDDLKDINFVNELIKENNEYEYIVVLSEGLDTSSQVYRNSDIKFIAPVVSMSAAIPDDLNSHGMANYPSAVFIQKNTFMGAYSNIESKGKFIQAISLFMNDDSIAYKSNNQNQ